MRCYAEFIFLDNNAKRARVRINFPPALFGTALLDTILGLFADAFIALSNAYLEGVTLYYKPARQQAGIAALPGSDVYQAAVLIYRNGEDYGTIEIRSPLSSFFETSGVYANVRISQDVYNASPELSQLGSLLAETVIPTTGNPFPTVFQVGGRTSQ